MLETKIPDSKITSLLRQVIIDNKDVWENIPPRNISKDLFLAKTIPNREEISKFECGIQLSRDHENLLEVADILGANEVRNSMVYYPMSMMGWHTNSDTTGKRIYYTFGVKESIFRYRDPASLRYINSYDNVGWTTREFLISSTQPLWHCVWTEGIRFSFGFNRPL